MKQFLRKYCLLIYWLAMFVVWLFAQLVTHLVCKTPWRWDLALVLAAIYATVYFAFMRLFVHLGIFFVRRK